MKGWLLLLPRVLQVLLLLLLLPLVLVLLLQVLLSGQHVPPFVLAFALAPLACLDLPPAVLPACCEPGPGMDLARHAAG